MKIAHVQRRRKLDNWGGGGANIYIFVFTVVAWIVKELDRKLAGVSVETYLRFVMS